MVENKIKMPNFEIFCSDIGQDKRSFSFRTNALNINVVLAEVRSACEKCKAGRRIAFIELEGYTFQAIVRKRIVGRIFIKPLD